MNIAIDLLPGQWKVINCESKYRAFVAGLGSGKTYLGATMAVMQAVKDNDGVVVAPTYRMLTDVTAKEVLTLLREWKIEHEFKKGEELVKLRNSTIYFRSGDNPEKLRGLNLNWAWLDEAALMREAVWKIVLGRLRIGKPQAWLTTTPAGFNWVYEYWVERNDKNYALFNASSRENTYLPKEYVEDLEDNYTGEFAQQEINGEFVAFEGLVYSEFSRNIHLIDHADVDITSYRKVRAIDYGYTNPFVCLWGAIDEDGRLYIYDEHYKRKSLMDYHASEIKRRSGDFEWTVADHDAQDNAEMRSKGISTTNAKKDVTRGIQKVKSRLAIQGDGKPRLYIMSNCVNTIKEISLYRWNEKKAGNEKEEPVKENDHSMDCLRYMIMQLDNRGIYVYSG